MRLRLSQALADRAICGHQWWMDGVVQSDDWEKIGEGASAEVWALDDRRVLKLFRADVNDVPIALEQAAGQWADAQGLAVARPSGRIRLDGREGIMFERVHGIDMLTAILRKPFRMWRLIARMARLQAQMHRMPGSEILPRQIDVLRHRILRSQAGDAAIQKAWRLAEILPTGDRLTHGDFHPGNLLLAERGMVVIDWAQASSGMPAADVARTELLLRFAGVGRKGASPLAALITAHWYRHCYKRYSGMSTAAINAWRLPVAVAWYRGQAGLPQERLARWIGRLVHAQPQ